METITLKARNSESDMVGLYGRHSNLQKWEIPPSRDANHEKQASIV